MPTALPTTPLAGAVFYSELAAALTTPWFESFQNGRRRKSIVVLLEFRQRLDYPARRQKIHIVGDPTDDVPRASAHEYVKVVVLYLSLRGSVIANARPIWGIEISLRTD